MTQIDVSAHRGSVVLVKWLDDHAIRADQVPARSVITIDGDTVHAELYVLDGEPGGFVIEGSEIKRRAIERPLVVPVPPELVRPLAVNPAVNADGDAST